MENIKYLKKYGWSISNKTNTLTIREFNFQVLPKIKFKRKKEKHINLGKIDLIKVDITTVERKTMKENRSRSWHGGGMQQDDINCHEEWTVDVIYFNDKQVKEILFNSLLKLGLPTNLEFKYNTMDKRLY